MTKSVQGFLESDDPLSPEACDFLLDYGEEDPLVDYKENFHPAKEKEWLEITKDIMAFANSLGGYLVFGVQDKTFKFIGIEDALCSTLADTNLIIQKAGRFVEPPVGMLRAKQLKRDGKNLVVLFIPPSLSVTHVVSKEGSFQFPSGEQKVVLRRGTIYVRRSAANHLADSRDLDDVFGRRLERFKESLLGKIRRVVEAPTDSEVFLLSDDPDSEVPHRRFIIRDAPDAIPVKGMSFTTAPRSTEQEIAGWISLCSRNQNAKPSFDAIWQWYEQRESLNLTEEQRLSVVKFSLFSNAPVFYWLHDCSAASIKQMLLEALKESDGVEADRIVRIATFLGKQFHNSLVKKVKTDRLQPKTKTFPAAGPRSLFWTALINSRKRGKSGDKDLQNRIEAELEKIAHDATGKKRGPGVLESIKAEAFDCYLYAQNDRYIKKA